MPNSVLIFEPSAVIRELCIDVLEASGFSVDTANDTVGAVTATMTTDYSFIIIGDSNSRDALTMPLSIREAEQLSGKYTPIIGVFEQRDRSACLSVGMDDCVQMPLSMNLLKQAIDRWSHYSRGRAAIPNVA